MKNLPIFSLSIALVFMQWFTTPVISADYAVATVTGAKQSTRNSYMAVVEDKNAESGWAVQIKRAISEELLLEYFSVFFHTRSSPKEEFNVSYVSSIYQLRKYQKQFLPKQIIDMIFPYQKGELSFKPGTIPILTTANVNRNFLQNTPRSKSNKNLFVPETRPYEMEVRLSTTNQAYYDRGTKYIFKVNFKIEDPK